MLSIWKPRFPTFENQTKFKTTSVESLLDEVD